MKIFNILILSLVLTLGSCSKGAKEEEKKPMTEKELIAQTWPNAVKTPSGLMYVVIKEGVGEKPKAGAQVTAHYNGTLMDGTLFDSSYKRGEPIAFVVGKGQVIKGWDEALLDMKKGEKRTLIIPYTLAYGEEGYPPVIPAKATLVFEVELVDFK